MTYSYFGFSAILFLISTDKCKEGRKNKINTIFTYLTFYKINPAAIYYLLSKCNILSIRLKLPLSQSQD